MVTTRQAAAIAAIGAFAASHPNGHPTLLALPLELRLQIIEFTFTELAIDSRNNRPALAGHQKAWIPPPILRSCRQLRLDGMKSFLAIDLVFELRNFDAKQMLAHYEWETMMQRHYPTSKLLHECEARTSIRPIAITDVSAAKDNIWVWIEAFFCNRAPGYFRQQDDDASRSQNPFAPFVCKEEPTQRHRHRQ